MKHTAKSGQWAISSESSLTPTTRPSVSRKRFSKVFPLFSNFWRGNYCGPARECGKFRGRWENHIRTASSRRRNCRFANSCIVRPRFPGLKNVHTSTMRFSSPFICQRKIAQCSGLPLSICFTHPPDSAGFFLGISAEKGLYLIHRIARQI